MSEQAWSEEHAACQRAVDEIKRTEEAKTAELREIYARGVARQEEINAALTAQRDALTKQIAEERARREALVAACYEEMPEGTQHLSMSGFGCRLCGWDCSPDFPEEHNPTCVLYDDGGPEAPTGREGEGTQA